MAVEDEATSKKKVLKKEYVTAGATKPGMHKKAPAKRVPMSKPRKVPIGETMKFTIESDDGKAAGDDKKKKRARTTHAKVLGKSTMVRDSEEEEEGAAPAPKSPKLMGDSIKSGAATSKPKPTPKATAQS